MRIAIRILVATAFLAALHAVPAAAHDGDAFVERWGDLPEVDRLADLHDELHDLLDRYATLERRAGRLWLATSITVRDSVVAADAVDAARARLEERVRLAYQVGPGGPLEALLGAGSIVDLATISEYTARTIAVDDAALHETILSEAVLAARRAQAEAARASLTRRLARLRPLLEELRAKVDEATALAEQAHVEDQALEEQRAAVAAAVSRAGSWDLGVIEYQQDQSHLLALLGPTGGRTCDVPEGLVPTGESFSGYASWYGWEFGGQPTATGAIFDPTLFTVASRTLPFGSFLRVHHEGRCAIVLVNDRGPYGRLERVLDLSMAAAQHLGVGVDWVDAEILIPRQGLVP